MKINMTLFVVIIFNELKGVRSIQPQLIFYSFRISEKKINILTLI